MWRCLASTGPIATASSARSRYERQASRAGPVASDRSETGWGAGQRGGTPRRGAVDDDLRAVGHQWEQRDRVGLVHADAPVRRVVADRVVLRGPVDEDPRCGELQ